MFEFIGIVVAIIIGCAILKVIAYRIFPEYGLKVAARRYQEDPSDANEKILWNARSRLIKSKQ